VQGSARNAVEFNGESDHIHILMSLPPHLDLSRFVNNLKTTSFTDPS
jgi:putative transposase